jgi:hypothetical protein
MLRYSTGKYLAIISLTKSSFLYSHEEPTLTIFVRQTSLLISSTMLEFTALLSSTQLQGTGL